ncbi:hypothetical protein SAMN04488061_0429 [Filomicrobium insigne]|uniref:Uncharacterized protein n=1 Tax=Filomicrobium insigne TaxID=418854 RepID=A0A1H0H8U9_9HYPH|nr:hypothetical protein SAMN04488061_0429 [Filomicrobium insigne]
MWKMRITRGWHGLKQPCQCQASLAEPLSTRGAPCSGESASRHPNASGTHAATGGSGDASFLPIALFRGAMGERWFAA